jgi:hypothetical protein
MELPHFVTNRILRSTTTDVPQSDPKLRSPGTAFEEAGRIRSRSRLVTA